MVFLCGDFSVVPSYDGHEGDGGSGSEEEEPRRSSHFSIAPDREGRTRYCGTSSAPGIY